MTERTLPHMAQIIVKSGIRCIATALFITAHSASAEGCRIEGLCRVIDSTIDDLIDVESYDKHGLLKLISASEGTLEADNAVNFDLVNVLNQQSEQQGDIEISEVLSTIRSFVSELSEAYVEEDTSIVIEGVSLFEKDGSNSEEYETYLEYSAQYSEVEANLNAAKTRSAKQFYADELESIDAEWVVSGFKFQIELLIRENDYRKLTNPRWIVEQLDSAQQALVANFASEAIVQQISSDAWNTITVRGHQHFPAAITLLDDVTEISGISFDVSEISTTSLPFLPENIGNFTRNYFSENECRNEDTKCILSKQWLGRLQVIEKVVLIKNIRIWSMEDQSFGALQAVPTVDFTSRNYIEMNGPFIYLTRKNNFGY